METASCSASAKGAHMLDIKRRCNLPSTIGDTLATVAEGVETEGQRRILNDLNCDCFQGYLVSEPIDAEKFEGQFLEPMRKD
jgi:predicted signal transduction protein with EAL and GGDEF domain